MRKGKEEQARLFADCCVALCGASPGWKGRMGVLLGIRADSIDDFQKGRRHIPPPIWQAVGVLLVARRDVPWGELIEGVGQQMDKPS